MPNAVCEPQKLMFSCTCADLHRQSLEYIDYVDAPEPVIKKAFNIHGGYENESLFLTMALGNKSKVPVNNSTST